MSRVSITIDKNVWLEDFMYGRKDIDIDMELSRYFTDRYQFKYYMQGPTALIYNDGVETVLSATVRYFNSIFELERFVDTHYDRMCLYTLMYNAPKLEYGKFDYTTGRYIPADGLELSAHSFVIRYVLLDE